MDELLKKFANQIDVCIDSVRLVHDEFVFLQIFKIETTAKGRIKETIIQNDLSNIVDDLEESQEPMFTVSCDIENNIEKLLSLDKVSLISTTDLFDSKAADMIDRKSRIFGISN